MRPIQNQAPEDVKWLRAFDEAVAELRRQLIALHGQVRDDELGFADAEERLAEFTREVTLQSNAALLGAADVDVPRIEVGGVEYERRSLSLVDYVTLAGAIAVWRWSYRQVGVHNGPTIIPLELRCGIVEGMTPAAARATGRLIQAVPSREAEVLSEALGALRIALDLGTCGRGAGSAMG